MAEGSHQSDWRGLYMEGLTKEILVTIPVTETHKRYLEEQASSGEYHCSIRYKAGKEVEAEDVKRANVIIGNVRPELLHYASGLELFQLNSAGADSYTGPGILPEGAVLANAKGAYGLAVSEHMLALTFSLIRRLPEYGKRQASHQWSPAGNIISVEGSVVLVLGLGDIGGDYARKMKALGAYVIGIRRTEKEKPEYLDEQYTMEQLDEVLGRADIVAMVLPGGDATNHVIDERRLDLMKEGAYLINVGRGSAIDPDALYQALTEGHLGGCGLDVTEPEPLPEDSPLWDLDHVIITPHVAGNFFLAETFERIVRIAGENLNAWANKKPLKNVVNLKAGY